MSAYRTNAGPQVAERPALTWWQQAVVQVFGPQPECRWWRAHVGGRWVFWRDVMEPCWSSHTECPVEWRRFTYEELSGANLFDASDMRSQNATIDEHRAGCTCEVYPWPTLGSALPPVTDTRAPGWYVISRSGAVLHVEEHVRAPAERAAFDLGRDTLRGRR